MGERQTWFRSYAERYNPSRSPRRSVVRGFAALTLVGWALLALPFTHRTEIAGLDHLFTAVSAATTTGLTTVVVGRDYTFWGQLIVLALIQVGGLSYLSLVTYYAVSTRAGVSGEVVEQLEASVEIPGEVGVGDFVRDVLAFTAVAEVGGGLVLFAAFLRRGQGVAEAAWSAAFHSVSAFCTAGLSLYPDSFVSFRDDPLVCLTLLSLAAGGAVGFLLVTQVRYRFQGRIPTLPPMTRAVLWAFAGLWVGGAAAALADPAVRAGPHPWLDAAFQAGTALTTVGYNTVPTGVLGLGLTASLLLLMAAGAAPTGTGGGIKLSNLVVVGAVVRARLHSDDEPRLAGEPISAHRSYVSTSTFALFIALGAAGVVALAYAEGGMPFEDLVFEAVSALGTVGLSRGITAELGVAAKVTLMALMFVGRLGVLTFAFALAADGEALRRERQEGDAGDDDDVEGDHGEGSDEKAARG